jgi:hypothetical protein
VADVLWVRKACKRPNNGEIVEAEPFVSAQPKPDAKKPAPAKAKAQPKPDAKKPAPAKAKAQPKPDAKNDRGDQLPPGIAADLIAKDGEKGTDNENAD